MNIKRYSLLEVCKINRRKLVPFSRKAFYSFEFVILTWFLLVSNLASKQK